MRSDVRGVGGWDLGWDWGGVPFGFMAGLVFGLDWIYVINICYFEVYYLLL